MKKYLNIYILSLVALSCVACTESEVDTTVSIDMSAEFATLTFDGECTYDGEEQKVIVSTTEAWSAEAKEDWIILSDASGSAGKNIFYVGVEENNGDQTRYGTIEITSGVDMIEVTVEQKHNRFLEIARSSYEVDGREQSFTILVSTNTDPEDVAFYIPTTDKEWISYSEPTSTTIEGSHVELKYLFTVTAQEADQSSRESEITISNSKLGIGDTFTIEQSLLPTFTIEDSERTKSVDYFEREVSVVLESNVEIFVDEESDWIESSDEFVEQEDGSKLYTLTLLANDSTEDRSYDVAFVYYTQNEINETVVALSEAVTITQKAKSPSVEITDERRSLYEATQNYTATSNFEVVVNSNVDLKGSITTIEGDWLKILSATPAGVDVDSNTTNGDDCTYTFSFSLTQNDEAASGERSATITFANVDNADNYTTLSITQAAEQEFIEVSDKESVQSAQSYAANSAFEVVVTSNEAVTASIATDWLTSVSGESVEGEATDITGVWVYKFIFSYDENFSTTAQERSQTIVFTSESGESDQVTITQEARLPIVEIADKSSIEASTQPYNVKQLSFSVSSDVALAVDITNSYGWSISPEVAANTDTTLRDYPFVVTIPDNYDSSNNRVVTIKFTSTTYGVEESLTITQAKMPAIISLNNFVGGTLAATLSEMSNLAEIEELVISGEGLTADDFTALTSNLTGLTSIDISATQTTEIPASTFNNWSALTYFAFPEQSLTTIGASAFNATGLTSLKVPSSLTTVGDMAFASTTALTEVDLTGVKVIGSRMFLKSGLTTVTIPASVEEWGSTGGNTDDNGTTYALSNAFQTCLSLTTIYLEDGLKTLPSIAFQGSTAIVSVTSYSATPPEIILPNYSTAGLIVYYAVHGGNVNTALIYVPADSVTAYQSEQGWSAYKNISAIE